MLSHTEEAFLNQLPAIPDYLPRIIKSRTVRSIVYSTPVFSVNMTGAGGGVVAGTADGTAYKIEYPSLTYGIVPAVDGQEVWSVSTDDSGLTTVIGTAQKKPTSGWILIFHNNRLIFTEKVPAPVWSVAVSRDGTLFAAGNWAGQINCYARTKHGSIAKIGDTIETPERKPVYGVTILADDTIAANVYGVGTIHINHRDRSLRTFHISNGVYSLSSAGSRFLYAAMSNGSVAKIDLDLATVDEIPVSVRPVYGVAVTPDNQVLVVGGTDGNVFSLTTSGVELWRQHCSAEVWSVAVSRDASKVVAGVADGSVQFIEDPCGVVGAGAVANLYRLLSDASPEPAVTSLQRVPWLSETFDVPRAGIALLARAQEYAGAHAGEMISATNALAAFASRSADLLLIGETLLSLQQYKAALVCFQRASDDPQLRSRSLILAAKSLKAMGLTTAATACSERASYTPLDPQRMRLLYEIGRNHEDSGDTQSASRIYEHLASWNASYRDCLDRVIRLQTMKVPGRWLVTDASFDFPLLGPDVPRPPEVDESIRPVVESRVMEANLSADARHRAGEMLKLMTRNGYFDTAKQDSLLYCLPDYLRYEYCSIEDSAKKHLEMIALSSQIRLDQVRHSLDIGTATCRYPQYFESLGINAAGVDLQAAGFMYARSTGSGFRNFVQGDGLALPFAGESFDLVTCMMGTFDHVPASHRRRLVDQMARSLVPGGWLALGVWNIDCAFQGFLSMYSQEERTVLRKMCATRQEIAATLTRAGFVGISETPIMCIPDSVLKEVNIVTLEASSMSMLLEIELAMRDRFKDPEAQMLLVCAQKPKASATIY